MKEKELCKFQCKQLWAAVLEQAIRDLVNIKMSIRSPEFENIRESALWWVRNRKVYIGSFTYICKVLELDEDIVRKEITKTYKNFNQANPEEQCLYCGKMYRGRNIKEIKKGCFVCTWCEREQASISPI